MLLFTGGLNPLIRLVAAHALPGQTVVAGTQVGTTGSSGHSSGTHLHYARVHCRSGMSVPSGFIEAGVPAGGTDVTSENAPTNEG